MALKPARQIIDEDVTFFSSGTASKGQVVVLGTATSGSGAAMDQAEAYVYVATNPSGLTPMGMLTCDIVNKDLTQTHLNRQKDEVQTGSKVAFTRKGWHVTDQVTGTAMVGGDTAYLTGTGLLTKTQTGGTPTVGKFLSRADEDGYVKVYIDLP